MSYYPLYLPTTPGVPVETIADVDKAVWIAHVLFISAMSVAFWDWVICLPLNQWDEYRYIWNRDFTLVTAVYVWSRYGFFVSGGVAVWVWLGGWDEATCEKRTLLGPGFMASVELAAMAVLYLRTWAVWQKHWAISTLCITFMLSYIGVQIYILKYQFTHVPIFRSQGPCIASGKPGTSSALYFALPLAYDVIVTTLLMIKLVPLARRAETSEVIRRLFVDGAFYAFLLSCVNAANTILLQSKLLNNAMLVPISFVLQATLTSRMILTLRATGESQNTGLETRSFWSRVQKADGTLPTFNGERGTTEPRRFSVHVVQSTVADGGYELPEKASSSIEH